jgi:hypothetical protein
MHCVFGEHEAKESLLVLHILIIGFDEAPCVEMQTTGHPFVFLEEPLIGQWRSMIGSICPRSIGDFQCLLKNIHLK